MKSRFSVRLFAYAFLHNHYHLLIEEPGRGIVSDAMHWFNGSVATRYNIRHEQHGHLWQGRFKNRVIRDERDLLQCMVYIDLNPARVGLTETVTDWPFSSAQAHADGTRNPLLDSAPANLTGYGQLLLAEWRRTQQLHQALRMSDRAASKAWLRQASSRSFIPFTREIARLLGPNFRRLIPQQPPTEADA